MHLNPVLKQEKKKPQKSADPTTAHTARPDGFKDNRPESVAQRQLQSAANNSPQIQQGLQLQAAIQSPTPKKSGWVGDSPKAPIQGYFTADVKGKMLAQERQKTEHGYSFLNEKQQPNIQERNGGRMRIAHDGNMAIEDGGEGRQPKMFYATEKVVAESNEMLLKLQSPIRLEVFNQNTIEVAGDDQQKRTLLMVAACHIEQQSEGMNFTGPENCNEFAGKVVGITDATYLPTKFSESKSGKLPNGTQREAIALRLAAILPSLVKNGKVVSQDLVELASQVENAKFEHQVSDESTQNEVVKHYVKKFLTHKESDQIMQEFGLNALIDPALGSILSIHALGAAKSSSKKSSKKEVVKVKDYQSNQSIKNPFPYHFAAVIAKSGNDYITLENYARQGEEGKWHNSSHNDSRHFFQMHGPQKQSFHSEHAHEYPNPMTISVFPKEK